MPKAKSDRINTVYSGGGHVVILGAGASIASTLRNPEPSGKHLPMMNNFAEVVGLKDIINSLPRELQARNFEKLYSDLYRKDPRSPEIMAIEDRVHQYFRDMQLPEKEATIYDYLILSLRPRDLIATFNWDPFLYQAYIRNSEFAPMPRLAFLHGNVAIGYDKAEKVSGPAGWYAKATGNYLEPTRLLYPVEQKDYTNDEYIATEWERVKYWLGEENTRRVTIFGYGAPKTDVEAVKLLSAAWGTPEKRSTEQFEIIDVASEKKVLKRWKRFVNSHHYDYMNDYFGSSLATNPRRTFESFRQHYMPLTIEEALSASNPVPKDIKTLEELWNWHQPLIDAELEYERQHPDEEMR